MLQIMQYNGMSSLTFVMFLWYFHKQSSRKALFKTNVVCLLFFIISALSYKKIHSLRSFNVFLSSVFITHSLLFIKQLYLNHQHRHIPKES